MKLIIDIPEENYNYIKNQVSEGITNPFKAWIANGIPLEDYDVLDKIMAEIEERETYEGIYLDRADVLQIIDKYKAERNE